MVSPFVLILSVASKVCNYADLFNQKPTTRSGVGSFVVLAPVDVQDLGVLVQYERRCCALLHNLYEVGVQ